jgi:hypothetical protein
MDFVVSKNGESVLRLSSEQLIEHLSGRIFKKQKKDIPILAMEIANKLQRGQHLGRISLESLIALSMQYGYYYRVFREKNEVSIDEEVSPDAGDESSSEIDS